MDALVVFRLREAGHDVLWASEVYHSSPDSNLLEEATRRRRTLITYDTDFGTLIHRDRMSAPYGVLLFRIHDSVPSEVRQEVVFQSVTAWDRWPPGIWTIQIRHSEQ